MSARLNWSREQNAALGAVASWLRRRDRQVFRLFGYAGTGKTTLARHLAEGVEGTVAFGAFTGKAAHVLRQKGCLDATTIHAMIYRPRGIDDSADGQPTFALRRDSTAASAALIVIDECSMVDEELGRDLLSFGKPILVLGDPGQLPPVVGAGFFTEGESDILLREVHRQARDNPIVRLSVAVRSGETLHYGTYEESAVVARREIDAARILAADQVLVGVNHTRRLYNRRIRELLGFSSPLPEVGDRLVCLRIDKTFGLLYCSLWRVRRLNPMRGRILPMTLTPDEGFSKRDVAVRLDVGAFAAQTAPGVASMGGGALPRGTDAFDFGYALTVHKAQGSQWDNVVLFDESRAFREHAARWLYTGITRAAQRLTVVR